MPSEEQLDLRARRLLFNAATLGAAVVVSAMTGPNFRSGKAIDDHITQKKGGPMNKLDELENSPGTPIWSENERGVRAGQMLLDAVTLGAAVVVCAISGPKLPPYQGE